MTIPEKTGYRCQEFNEWFRKYGPDSEKDGAASGFLVSDIDLVLYNYKTKKLMMVETKGKGDKVPKWQELMFKYIDRCMAAGMQDGWEYLGFHTIRLENTTVYNGRILLNDKLITPDELIKFLSF